METLVTKRRFFYGGNGILPKWKKNYKKGFGYLGYRWIVVTSILVWLVTGDCRVG